MATSATASNAKPILLWFRRDLRLADNPALSAALAQNRPVIPLFIHDESSPESRPLGGASRWWLGKSLTALDQALGKLGARLILRRGSTLPILRQIVADTGATELHLNRRFDAAGMKIDRDVINTLQAGGVDVVEHDGNYLHEPTFLKTQQGQSFKVFTPFWRRLLDHYSPGLLLAPPRQWSSSTVSAASDPLASFQFSRRWSEAFGDHWQPGEAGARRALKSFAEDVAEDYAATRDRPDLAGTSRLSPHLAWGEISVHRAWTDAGSGNSGGVQNFRRELGWRDFNMHVLFHFPALPQLAWQEPFRAFPFKMDKAGLTAWQRGNTGYPMVDAGMRELWHTGWMHNRVRMIVASFLIKHQLIDWHDGEAWFWDTLVDADLAQNAGNWQWVAGCGFDAAPFFRIFNPMLQGEKFDPKGDYIRRWVPELAKLKTRDLQAPWKLSTTQLAEADIALGRDYPQPVVQHEEARARALTAYKRISGKGGDAQADLFSD
jgi:deoxyribodipyrimidine photo-lyase